jgi:hypothetical protein
LLTAVDNLCVEFLNGLLCVLSLVAVLFCASAVRGAVRAEAEELLFGITK